MNITVLGGGPAGLYFAIQMLLQDANHRIRIVERNPEGSTFGWGVVFSDETLKNFLASDPVSSSSIRDSLYHWDDIDIFFRDRCISSSGHGFSGIGRHKLLEILLSRARELGAQVQFEHSFESLNEFADADLIVAADGINSTIRNRFSEHFEPEIDSRLCRYIWLGTDYLFRAFTFIFEETEHGWFQAHCYRFSEDTSTFIVECPENVWRKAGLDRMSKDEGIRFCEKLFGRYIDERPLRSNTPHITSSDAWITFRRIHCRKWFHENVVLLGDSSATAHYSIGSGTKLAMESAIALANTLEQKEFSLQESLEQYQKEREVEVFKLQSAARNSTEWFENIGLKSKMKPEQFAYSLLTRSQRVSHESLRARDRKFLENYENWLFEEKTGKPPESLCPPMFIPYRIKDLELPNRVAVSPMAMYSARDGVPSDFHLVHLGSRALGGAGLIFTEMTCVSPEGRITPGCAGLYSNEHTKEWKKIVDFIHQNSPAKVAVQLGHAGRKGSTRVGWEGMDHPLVTGNWPLLAPSPLPWSDHNQVPKTMDRSDMEIVKQQFVQATERATLAGFDLLELHCAHGYLLSSFISPLTNQRRDEFGGTLENRMRFPLEILEAVRQRWPSEKPLSVRISATDWFDGGVTIDDAVEIARLFVQHGADLIDVSAGQVTPLQRPVYGRMFQTPFADRIRSELDVAVMAVGNIFEPDHVNSIIASGRADLCLLARPHLSDPHWTLHAAAELGYQLQWWPNPYLSGKQQLFNLVEKSKQSPVEEPI